MKETIKNNKYKLTTKLYIFLFIIYIIHHFSNH